MRFTDGQALTADLLNFLTTNAGGGYPFDAAFTIGANTSDPEAGGAGWAPDFAYGAAAVAMTDANVTLTPAQWGKPAIVITGVLTANLNLIFPDIVGQWQVVNSTTGAFAITAKTASGTGVALTQGYSDIVASDGTNVRSATDKYAAPSGSSLVGWIRNAVDAVATTVAKWMGQQRQCLRFRLQLNSDTKLGTNRERGIYRNCHDYRKCRIP